MTKALIGAGCFWGIQEYYRKIDGVLETKVGFSGGKTINPTYEDVCFGNTDHVEVVEIFFDPKIIDFIQIINYFWTCHDPTQLNRQGPDIGRQYRSVIFYYNNEQKLIALNSKKNKQKNIIKPIVTEIMKAQEFYLAEDYHQFYLQKRV